MATTQTTTKTKIKTQKTLKIPTKIRILKIANNFLTLITNKIFLYKYSELREFCRGIILILILKTNFLKHALHG